MHRVPEPEYIALDDADEVPVLVSVPETVDDPIGVALLVPVLVSVPDTFVDPVDVAVPLTVELALDEPD